MLVIKDKRTIINNILIIKSLFLRQIDINNSNLVYNQYFCFTIKDLKIFKYIKTNIVLQKYVA